MNRPKKVRVIYLALRRALGDRVTSQDALRSAAAMVEIFDDREGSSFIRLPTPRPTFDELPVDKAMADGGWRVMRRESNWVGPIFSEEPEEHRDQHGLRSLTMELEA